MSELYFSEGHAENLRNVQLHLLGVMHGDYVGKPGIGYVDHAPDSEYREVKKLIGSLSAERGDVVSYEQYGYADEAQRQLAERNQAARNGTLLHGQHPGMLAYRRFSTPMDYAEDLALDKKIPVCISDISKKEAAELDELIDELPWIGRLAIHLAPSLQSGPREQIKLIKLANRAKDMQVPADAEKPVLAHVVGAFHVGSMGATLRAADVPFTTNLSGIRILPHYTMLKGSLQRVGPREIQRRRMSNPPAEVY
jgi:hypothetical protein